MVASESPDAERWGATTWKFEACLRPGAAAASSVTADALALAFAFPCAPSGWRGSTDTTEPASIVSEPVTLPPVFTGYGKNFLIVVGASGSFWSITSSQAL